MKDFFKRFESVNALVTYLDNAQVTDTFRGHEHSKSSDSSFYGYDSYEQARKMLLNGDKELQKHLRGTAKLDINVPSTATRNMTCAALTWAPITTSPSRRWPRQDAVRFPKPLKSTVNSSILCTKPSFKYCCSPS